MQSSLIRDVKQNINQIDEVIKMKIMGYKENEEGDEDLDEEQKA